MPINIDVAGLVTAFNTTTNSELGTHLRLTSGTGLPRFNGILFISRAIYEVPPGPGGHIHIEDTRLSVPISSFSPISFDGLTSVDRGDHAGLIGAPIALDSDPSIVLFAEAEPTTAPYTALRLHNAADLTAFIQTGFTVVSSLPVYVEGDFNTAVDGSGNRAAALITAPAVFFMRSGTAELLAWDLDVTTADIDRQGDAAMVAHVSLVTTVSLAGGELPATEGIRVVDMNQTLELHGSITLTGPSPGREHDNVSGGGNIGVGDVIDWRYPLALTTATKRTETDRRLPPGTPRVSFPQGSITVVH
ncbi:MAG: hypothetical protein Q8O67_33630 [Deltaproteobacteria bacterium]|nr:hypothetical protein [Deltaproteobacteria bacterium]